MDWVKVVEERISGADGALEGGVNSCSIFCSILFIWLKRSEGAD